jgi:serine/threonine protein kinase
MNVHHTELLFAETKAYDTAAGFKGPDLQQLQNSYASIIRDRAIYYPVAYRFEKVLGRGRQGIVFEGLRQGARGCITRHAIKLFDPSIYPNAEKYWTDMGRLANQVSLLHTLRSPNLVSRDSYEEVNGIGYVQMEKVDGVDLRYFLDGKHLEKARKNSSHAEWSHFTDVIFRTIKGKVTLQPGIALYILRKVLYGLDTLHEKNYGHCDIKPSNIMLDCLGNVKLVDYGRAVQLNEKTSFLMGTPLYMAPEVYKGSPYLAQSDLFSVGLLAIELLTGTPIISTPKTDEEELYRKKMALSDHFEEKLPEYISQNEEFVYLLRKFIDPDPNKRYHCAVDAESGSEGLRIVHKQLTQLGKDAVYDRELRSYLRKILPIKENSI